MVPIRWPSGPEPKTTTPRLANWLNRIEAQFTNVHYIALESTDPRSHAAPRWMIPRYIAGRHRKLCRRLRVNCEECQGSVTRTSYLRKRSTASDHASSGSVR
jgi:hypothetical protein